MAQVTPGYQRTVKADIHEYAYLKAIQIQKNTRFMRMICIWKCATQGNKK